MKRDIIYIFIIVFLAVTVSTFNEELKRNYEKGYNDRQAEIMQLLEDAENQCNYHPEEERKARGTVGIMLDKGIRLLNDHIETDDYVIYYDSNIIYQCKTGRHWTVDPIWIGDSRCECIEFGLK